MAPRFQAIVHVTGKAEHC